MAKISFHTIEGLLKMELEFGAGVSQLHELGSEPSKQDIENSRNAEQLGTQLQEGKPKDQLTHTVSSWPSPIDTSKSRSEFLAANQIRSSDYQHLHIPTGWPEKPFVRSINGTKTLEQSEKPCANKECSCNQIFVRYLQQLQNPPQQGDDSIDFIDLVVPQEERAAIARARSEPKEKKMALHPQYCPLECVERAAEPYARRWIEEQRRQNKWRRRATAKDLKNAERDGGLRLDDDSSSDKTLSGDEEDETDRTNEYLAARARATLAYEGGVKNNPRHNYNATEVHFNCARHGRAPPTRPNTAFRASSRQEISGVAQRQSAARSAAATTPAEQTDLSENTTQIIQTSAPSQVAPPTATSLTVAEWVHGATSALNNAYPKH